MKLTHPKSGVTIEVRPAHAGTYQSQGWVQVKPKRAPKNNPSK